MTVFKAYDIRGLYGTQIDAALARQIGRAYVAEVEPRTVVVGHDMRPCAPEIADALVEPALKDASPGQWLQLERQGYFCVDRESTPGRPVLNRTTTLRDSWATISAKGAPAR